MKKQRDVLQYHPVTFVPTNDPKYIDGQVSDILCDYQEQERKEPFRPGPIGALPSAVVKPTHLGMPLDQFEEMNYRLWMYHDHLPRAKKRKGYTVTDDSIRKSLGIPDHIEVAWHPEKHLFQFWEVH